MKTKLITCLLILVQIQFIKAQVPVIQWQKTIGGSDDDDAYVISKTFDGGSFIAGSSTSPISGDKNANIWGSYDYWVVKLDSVGNIQWQKTIGGNGWDFLQDAV